MTAERILQGKPRRRKGTECLANGESIEVNSFLLGLLLHSMALLIKPHAQVTRISWGRTHLNKQSA